METNNTLFHVTTDHATAHFWNEEESRKGVFKGVRILWRANRDEPPCEEALPEEVNELAKEYASGLFTLEEALSVIEDLENWEGVEGTHRLTPVPLPVVRDMSPLPPDHPYEPSRYVEREIGGLAVIGEYHMSEATYVGELRDGDLWREVKLSLPADVADTIERSPDPAGFILNIVRMRDAIAGQELPF